MVRTNRQQKSGRAGADWAEQAMEFPRYCYHFALRSRALSEAPAAFARSLLAAGAGPVSYGTRRGGCAPSPALLKTSSGSRVRTDVLLVRPMLERLALLLSAFASLFKSTERLDAKEPCCAYRKPHPVRQAQAPEGACLGNRSAFSLRPVAGAISVSSLKICCRRILGTRRRRPAGGEAGWCGSGA